MLLRRGRGGGGGEGGGGGFTIRQSRGLGLESSVNKLLISFVQHCDDLTSAVKTQTHGRASVHIATAAVSECVANAYCDCHLQSCWPDPACCHLTVSVGLTHGYACLMTQVLQYCTWVYVGQQQHIDHLFCCDVDGCCIAGSSGAQVQLCDT